MVTVLLATYNGGKFLEEQLNSLLNQSFQDFRIVIRDDGSTDNTLEIIERYKGISPEKIEICQSFEKTRSAAGNFFKLIELYSDDYIMFCDQDDCWLPDKIEKTLNAMKKAEAEFGTDTPILVHTDLKVVDEELNLINNSFIKLQKLSPENTKLNNLLMQNSITGCTAMFNKALLEKLFILPNAVAMHDWWLGLIAACFGKIIFIKEPTILYRQHSNNEVGAKDVNSLSFIIKKLKNFEKMKSMYKTISLQALFLKDNYSEFLDYKQKKLLSDVADLPNKNKWQKIKILKKHRLFKNSVFRKFAQILFI